MKKYVEGMDSDKLANLEARVDALLLKAARSGQNYPVRVDYGVLGTGLYEEILLERYRKLWQVEEKNNSSSWDYGVDYWYEFSPKKGG